MELIYAKFASENRGRFRTRKKKLISDCFGLGTFGPNNFAVEILVNMDFMFENEYLL